MNFFNTMETKKPVTYFFIFTLLLIALLAFLIVKPYISSLLSAIVLTYIFYPLYLRFNKKVKNKHFAASLVIIIIFLIVIIPIVFIANAMLKESINIYQSIRTIETTGITEKIQSYFPDLDIDSYISIALQQVSSYFIGIISKFISSITDTVIKIFVLVFAMFYFFSEGPNIIRKFTKIVPLKDAYKKRLFTEFEIVTKAIVHGSVIVALIQGLIGTIGLIIFQSPQPILFGAVMTILAMIPFLGTALVWLPISIYLYLTGKTLFGILLFLYGLIIVINVDNVLKPKIISVRSNIHPLIVLIGLFGGLKIFGIVGVVIGPLILSYLIIFLRFYSEEYAT